MNLSAAAEADELSLESVVFHMADRRKLATMDVRYLSGCLMMEKQVDADLMLAVAELINEHILPDIIFATVLTSLDIHKQALLQAFLQHGSLTEDALDMVFTQWLAGLVEETSGRVNPVKHLINRMPAQVYGMFLTVAQSQACSVSMMGTFWRVASALFAKTSALNVLVNLTKNPNAPIPLLAYAFQQATYFHLDFQPRLHAHYPELADLPLDMLVDIAVHDIYPPEWFINQSVMPDGLRWLTPVLPAPEEESS